MHDRFLGGEQRANLYRIPLITIYTLIALFAPQALAHDCEPEGSITRIVALGDSMTTGEGTSYGAYRGYLAQRAAKEGKPIEFLGSLGGTPNNPPHEGWVGYEVRDSREQEERFQGQLYGKLTERVMKGYTPDVVILWAGSNYLCCTRDLPPLPDRYDMETRGFVAKAVYDVELLLGQIFELKTDVRVLLVGLPSSPAVHPDFIDLYNNGMTMPKMRGLKELVSKFQGEGRSIRMVEGIEKVVAGKALFEDELHPTDEGYKIIADVIYHELEAFLNQSSSGH